MPKIPQPSENIKATSTQILNGVREEIGGTYADMVPVVHANNLETLHEAGRAILDYVPNRNAFLATLFNRIGRALIKSKFYENPWAMFKKGFLEYGETIEEIFVNLAHIEDFNPDRAENELFKREKPDVRAAFHTMNYQKMYKTTVSEPELRQAFLSFDGVNDLLNRIIERLYTSANYDEFLVMKYMTARAIIRGAFYPVEIPAVTKENATDIVREIKTLSNDLTFMATKYNQQGVHNLTPKSEQMLLCGTAFDALIGVDVLANAFNLEYVQFMGQRVLFDDLTGSDDRRLAEIFKDDPTYTPLTENEKTLLKTVPAIIVDREWFMIFDNYLNTNDVYNPQGLYQNFMLHTWKTFSVSPFENAVAFTTQASTVTGVVVSPATATVTPGQSIQLSAVVNGSGLNIDGVTWSIPEGSDGKITNSGLFTANAGVTDVKEIVVTATSIQNPAVAGTATITINP